MTDPEPLDRLLDRILSDTGEDRGPEEAFARAFQKGIAFPLEAHVLGEPVQVLGIEPVDRIGLVATCRKGDATHDVPAWLLRCPPETPAGRLVGSYRTWLDLDPFPSSDPDPPPLLDGPVELVVLGLRGQVAHCRVLDTGQRILLRATDGWKLCPGEVATVQGRKQWVYGGHSYLSGEVVGHRLDVEALQLPPLGTDEVGDWDPEEHYWGEEEAPPRWAEPMLARGVRPVYKMELVLPGAGPGSTNPVVEAVERRHAGDPEGARRLLMDELIADLRCLDAHAHLGIWDFDSFRAMAQRRFAVGVALGEQALGDDFDGVLPWGFVQNRPFLRCLHGYGLCLHRAGREDEALEVFERMLWLNPTDNQGARMLLAEFGDQPPAATALDVDWSDLLDAFAHASEELAWYLDRETGEVLFVAEFERLEEQEPIREALAADPDRYLRIEPETSREGWRDMKAFVDQVQGPEQERLARAIRGRGAFGRFKDAIHDLKLADSWHRFAANRRADRALEWLVERGIEPASLPPME